MSEKPASSTVDGGEGGATGNSEGGTTMALQKKRLRRVSFAEMTSIHFFDRDEDNETPAEEATKQEREDNNGAKERDEKSDLLGFHELLDSRGEDEEEDRELGDGDSEDEELALMRRSFLRPAESPSPGSTFGSATSHDEDDFFGPVSASFIRPGRLSDSAASDDKHDVTMDSTAFSMHFRSLARSDSGIGLKTPTGVRLSFEEKTPTHTTAGSSMELTVPRKPISQLSSPAANSESSDMSLVGEKSSEYDYGRISPGLDALLAEGSRNLHTTSASDINVASKSPRYLESQIFPSNENGSALMVNIHNRKAVSPLDNRRCEANDDFSTSAARHSVSEISSNASKPIPSDILVDYSNSSPSRLSQMRTSPSHQDNLGLKEKYIPHESPLSELVSSSTAKERQTLANSIPPTQDMYMVTPQGQKGSLRHNEDVKHHDSVSSIQRSISKLKLLEASPFSPYLTAKIDNPTIEAMNFLSHSPVGSERVINDFQIQTVDTALTGTEGKPLGASQKQKVLRSSGTNDNLIEDPVKAGDMIHYEESKAAAASASEFTWSDKKMKHDLFRSGSPRENELVTVRTGTNSNLAEISLDHVGERKKVSTLNKFVPSPVKESEKKLKSPKLPGPASNVLMLHDQLMKLKENFPGNCESASKGDITDSSMSTVSLNEFDSCSLHSKVQTRSPLIGFSKFNSIEVNHHNQQRTFEMIENLRTSAEAKEFLCPKKLEWGPQTGSELQSFEGDRNKADLESAFPYIGMSLKESILQKDLVGGFTKGPSTKEVQLSNDYLSNAEDVLSASTKKLNSLSRKRSNEVVIVEEKNHISGLGASQRSPKLQKVGNNDMQTVGCPNQHHLEISSIAHEPKHWTDIYSRFLKESEKLLSTPVDKLNHSVIELLENIIFNLQRSKTYGILNSEISAQKTSVILDLRHQRVSEARSLLHQIIHEKTKSQLACVKRQKLQEKVQLLSSGIQESQMLKLKFMCGCKGDAVADAASTLQAVAKPRHREEVACDKVIAMKQCLEALDKTSANLIKSLTTACKFKGEPSGSDSMASVTNHLMKKSYCRFFRLDMQMWIIDDMKRKNGHWDIVLNYLDFIVQSFKVPVPTASSMIIYHKLDDINIHKSFPNMDACAVFSFVFNAETTRKFSGSRSLAEEIQVTSSFLGTLVDVVQEVQLARIELRHLTRTFFHCLSVEQLYLQAVFFNFESGGKVTMTLDLSCLKRGVYPSEVLPSHITVAYGAKTLPTSPVLDEIRDALKSLRAGYTRIIRLCRCISQIIQVSRKW